MNPGHGGQARRMRLVPPDAERRNLVIPLGTTPGTRPALIGIAPADARHHVHVLGPTGTGKSTLLINLVCGEARAGRGVAVFDPKGDLIRDLLDRLPASAGQRLVLIDPDEDIAPPALNLFTVADDPEAVADQLVGVMAKVWAQYWGPRTDDIARHTILTLAHSRSTATAGAHAATPALAGITELLASPFVRKWLLKQMRDRLSPVDWAVLSGFWAWYDAQTPAQAATQTGPLLSKLRAVTCRRFTTTLFGPPVSTFDLADILDGGILLVRLPKGVLGDDTVRLTGSLLLAALLHTARARAGLPEQQRRHATLVIDECHNFLNLPIGLDDALAEARGLGLSLVLAHQHLGQLTPPIAAAISANARNKIWFSLAPEDARDQAHHTAPFLAAEDLTSRDAYGITCRLVIDGRDSEPFTLTTRPAPPAWPGREIELRAAARAHGLPTTDREVLADTARLGPGHTRQPTTPPPTRTPAPGAAPQPAQPNWLSTVTKQATGKTGASPGGRPGGSPVHGTPGEPPPGPPLTPQARPPDGETGLWGDWS